MDLQCHVWEWPHIQGLNRATTVFILLTSHLDYFNSLLILLLNFTLFPFNLFLPSIQSGVLKCNSSHIILPLCSKSFIGTFAHDYKRVVDLGLTFLLKTKLKYSQEKVIVLWWALHLTLLSFLFLLKIICCFYSWGITANQKTTAKSCGSLIGL